MTQAFTSSAAHPVPAICHLRYTVGRPVRELPEHRETTGAPESPGRRTEGDGHCRRDDRSVRLRHGDDPGDSGQGAGARHRVRRACGYVARRQRRRREAHRPQELRRPRSRAARRSVDGAARGRQPRAGGTARQRHHHRVGADAARFGRQVGRRGNHGRRGISDDASGHPARRGQNRLYAGRGSRPRHAVFRREPLRRAVRLHARWPEARRARDRKFLGRCDDHHLQGLQCASRVREGAHGERHQAGVRVRASPPAQRPLARNDRRLRGVRASRTASKAASSARPSSCCCAISSPPVSTTRRAC